MIRSCVGVDLEFGSVSLWWLAFGIPRDGYQGVKSPWGLRLECDTLFRCTSHNLELTEVAWALLFTQFHPV